MFSVNLKLPRGAGVETGRTELQHIWTAFVLFWPTCFQDDSMFFPKYNRCLINHIVYLHMPMYTQIHLVSSNSCTEICNNIQNLMCAAWMRSNIWTYGEIVREGWWDQCEEINVSENTRILYWIQLKGGSVLNNDDQTVQHYWPKLLWLP